MNVGLRAVSAKGYVVTLGSVSLGFSYETLVAYKDGEADWVVSENVWGQTTGKHLNLIGGRGTERTPREAFLTGLDALLGRLEMRRGVFQ